MKAVFKMTLRTIRTFFGRYIALLLIVALSAGFFAGLKITTDAMRNTGENYLKEQSFYDFRLFSTLGFTEEDVKAFSELAGIKSAEGSNSMDVLIFHEGSEHPFKLYALPDKVNLPSLIAGRMPTAKNECLADGERFTEDDIGTTLSLSSENDDAVTEQLSCTEYTIVGIADSPLHLGIDRGSTNIGSGSIYTFLYLPQECFTCDVYTELNLTLNETAAIYSDEYDDLIDSFEGDVTDLCDQRAEERYQELLTENGLTPELGAQFGIEAPETYVLTRNENAGYVAFENDTAILSGVANIFPVFFIMIAILVCITTMTRMVDEERTQIGVLKAMGFSNGSIMAKYLLYAGSATLIGWAVGFFLCTWALPEIFWFVYDVLYGFTSMTYLFSPELAVLTLAISLIGILGSTYFACRRELSSVPATLIRPRAAKNGKRVFLEYITPLWKRLSFLQKITVRNMFRYKQRLIMMLVGIGCCAGLVVTAFGIRDSIVDIGVLQFGDVQKYDIEATFNTGTEDDISSELDKISEIDRFLTVSASHVDLQTDKTMNSVNLISFKDADDLSEYWDFHSGDDVIAYPESGEAIINTKIAETLDLSVGDTLQIRDADMQTGTVTVSGIFDNYIYNYVFISDETYTDLFGEWSANTALLSVSGEPEDTAKLLTDVPHITGVSQLSILRDTVTDALDCLDYIIWLVVGFSGALAFVVIFNLTNINLAERSREIATVQVLGFYPKETESYALRENLILSVIASLIGLPLGNLFHRAVMSMVNVDMFSFNVCVTPLSYLTAFVCTVLFAVIVNLFMKRQIGKINMAESLKAVE